ncbi:MAG: hypothetical protein J7M27_11085 [Candidatus Latescibacteria bacterium]|nr:hypothetical protein [Candidatus Latescibacterota bacterium]
MIYAKRVTITTILGVITGLLCYLGGVHAGIEFTTGLMLATIFNRTFIGFVIGISAIRIHYLLHGILIGALGSITMGVASIDQGLNGLMMITLFGMLWGLLIEGIATKGFKAEMRK